MTLRNMTLRGIGATVSVVILAVGLLACGASSVSQEEVVGDRAAQAASATPAVGATTTGATPSAAATLEPGTVAQALSNIYANLSGFQGTVTVDTNPGGSNSTTTVVDQSFLHPNYMKLEITQSSVDPKLAGSMLVFDGTTLTVYDASTNRALQITDPSQVVLLLNLSQQRFFPVLQIYLAQQYLASLAQNAQFSVDGSDTVAGRPTTIVNVTPQNPPPGGGMTVKLWLDDQTRDPLRAQLIGSDGSVLENVEYTAFDPNAQLSASDFTFTPPSGATVVTPTPSDIESFAGFQASTLQDVQSSAGFPILQPTNLPSGVSLQSVGTLTVDNSTSVALLYGTSPQDISTSLIEVPADRVVLVIRGSQTVAIAGSTSGQIYSDQTMTVIDWTQGTTALTLATTLPRSDALQMAQSVQ